MPSGTRPPKERKIAVMGSRSVGKSSLIKQFCRSEYVDAYHPTIEDVSQKTLVIQSQPFNLSVYDTAGQDEYSNLVPRHATCEGHVLVYSIAWRQSFEMLSILRDKILDHTGMDTVPMIIVANKSDRTFAAIVCRPLTPATVDDKRAVGSEEGEALAKSWDCAFVEASAKEGVNVGEIFTRLVIEIEKTMDPPPDQGGEGCIVC